MKKNATSMFVFFSCAALLLVSVGCAEENPAPPPYPDEGVNLYVDADNALQYATNGALSVAWESGAQVGVFAGKSQNVPFTLARAPGNSLGDFHADRIDQAQSYSVYTPYDASASVRESVLTFNLPLNQHFVAGNISDYCPMVGVTTTLPRVQLKNLCGIMKIKLWAELDTTVASVEIKATDGQKLSGEASVDLNFGLSEPELVMSQSGSDLVTVDYPQGVQVAEGESTILYVLLPPQTYTGLEVTVKAAGGKQTTSQIPGSLTIGRGEVASGVELVVISPPEAKPTTGTDLNDAARYGIATSAEVFSNCYMVDAAGAYYFNACVIGNGDEGVLRGAGFHTDVSRIRPRSADLLWQDVDGAVTNVTLSPERNFVSFDAVTVPANAVIAVYDGEDGTGNILWSWHIWLSGKPRDHQYKNAAGQNTFLVMDRNLGALDAPETDVQADIEAMPVARRFAAYGLQYQWGRKDPFIGNSTYNGIKDKVMFGKVTTIAKKAPTATGDEEYNNILYAVRNPVTFITINKTFGWTIVPVDELWGNPTGGEIPYARGMKTIYDPCPVGYSVPPANTWLESEFDKTIVSGKLTAGRMFGYDGINLAWYPAAGMRWDDDGSLNDANRAGYYWTNTPFQANKGTGLENWYGSSIESVMLISGYSAAASHNIRCVRE